MRRDLCVEGRNDLVNVNTASVLTCDGDSVVASDCSSCCFGDSSLCLCLFLWGFLYLLALDLGMYDDSCVSSIVGFDLYLGLSSGNC